MITSKEKENVGWVSVKTLVQSRYPALNHADVLQFETSGGQRGTVNQDESPDLPWFYLAFWGSSRDVALCNNIKLPNNKLLCHPVVVQLQFYHPVFPHCQEEIKHGSVNSEENQQQAKEQKQVKY